MSGQDLFSSMLSESKDGDNSKLSINGYSRGTIFTGWNYQDKADIKSVFGETALKMSAKPNKWGSAYTDIRFRSGLINGNRNPVLDIREAYADIYLGKFDFRFGKQIKSWGRADAFNPTQNLTPQNYFLRSPVEDDKRMGNLVFTGKYNPVHFLRVEFDWVPFYSPSIYDFELVGLPEFVSFADAALPTNSLNNGSLGLKIDIILNKLEGSLSWFSGYDPMMGLTPGVLPAPPFTDFNIQLIPKPFRQSTLGGDIAFNLGSFGIRGEAAWEKPDVDDNNPAKPMEEISWALGLDRSFGPVRLLIEYYGKNIMDFSPLEAPGDFDPAMLQDPNTWPYLEGMLGQQIGFYNRILYDQTEEWIHSLLVRPSLSLFHETLELEAACLYNFTTKEYMLRPMLSYQVADGIEIMAGYEYYYGPENTRFNWIKKVFNGPFGEIRISF
jgi:hypothetical protein